MKRSKLLSFMFLLIFSFSQSIFVTRTVYAVGLESTGRHSFVYASAQIIHVPGDYSNLQDAINHVADGGIIEIAGGTYTYNSYYQINDIHKSITIRAASGSTVVLSGNNSHEILKLTNSSVPSGQGVIFDGITFANGYGSTDGSAAGVTIVRANAVFTNCFFNNNHGNQPITGGGGVVVSNATAFFINSSFSGNFAKNFGGAISDETYSKVIIHNSQFVGNRTNLPGHPTWSSGGAIHVGNSVLRVSNSRFDSNQAGYVGGAIYAIGNWVDPVSTPTADVIISNSTFVNNQAYPDTSVPLSSPTEGGAVHTEDQATTRIYNSRFITNRSMNGAVTMYRSIVQIEGSVFLGNQATGGGMGGFGGAISSVSNDNPGDGNVNRRTASLTIDSSYFQGRYGNVTTVGEEAGGVFMGGDINRNYGINGVNPMGDADSNRATLTIHNSIFNDLDVQKESAGSMGGSVQVDLTNLNIQNCLFLNSDALGSNGASGGAVSIIRQSLANISGSIFAKDTSGTYGGAIYVSGSQMNLSNNKLIENNTPTTQYGTAIFSAPMEAGYNLAVSGNVSGNILSNNGSTTYVFDDDRDNGPINDIRYNSNQFYNSAGVNAQLYSDSIQAPGRNYKWLTIAQLNTLMVQRANGTSTDKSQQDNIALSSAPKVGAIIGVPSVLSGGASGDPGGSTAAYLGYAWSGANATLDGQGISGNAGISSAGVGNHTLNVGGSAFQATIGQAPTPAASFSATGGSGSPYTLNWSVTSGSFLDVAIDHGIVIPSNPSGSVQASSSVDSTYYFYAITKEGGVVKSIHTGTPILDVPAQITVLVGQNLPENLSSISIQNIGGGTMSWSAAAGDAKLITLQRTSGQTSGFDTLIFQANGRNLSLGDHPTYIDINAGEAGSQRVSVIIRSVQHVFLSFLPVSSR